jgi:hypothetical protein
MATSSSFGRGMSLNISSSSRLERRPKELPGESSGLELVAQSKPIYPSTYFAAFSFDLRRATSSA